MMYSLLKGLHVVSMVAWMAAALYLGRLCVYYAETASKTDAEKLVLRPQLALMMRRLMYGIGHPSMLLTIVFGGWTMFQFGLLTQPWFHLKLNLALVFVGYYIYLGILAKKMMKGKECSGLFLRILNEVATAFLISIVIITYLKSALSPIGGAFLFVATLSILVGLVFLLNGKSDASK